MKKLIVFIFLILFLISVDPIQAQEEDQPSYVTGTIYIKADGGQWPLKDVVLFRKKSPWTQNPTQGIPSVTNAAGLYRYVDNEPFGPFSVCGSDLKCPGFLVGSQANESETHCDMAESCGLACNGDSPFRWLAYFPVNYDTNNLPPGIYFESGDPKGGGSWQVESGGTNHYMAVSPGNADWTVNMVNFGSVTYKPNEWYRSEVTNNSDGIGNMNIEWLPGNRNFSCTDLTRTPTTSLSIGDQVTFTCSHSTSNLTFGHYEYRLKGPTDADWQILTSPEYTIPTNGNYTVQCRVCSLSNYCTNWGQAE